MRRAGTGGRELVRHTRTQRTEAIPEVDVLPALRANPGQTREGEHVAQPLDAIVGDVVRVLEVEADDTRFELGERLLERVIAVSIRCFHAPLPAILSRGTLAPGRAVQYRGGRCGRWSTSSRSDPDRHRSALLTSEGASNGRSSGSHSRKEWRSTLARHDRIGRGRRRRRPTENPKALRAVADVEDKALFVFFDLHPSSMRRRRSPRAIVRAARSRNVQRRGQAMVLVGPRLSRAISKGDGGRPPLPPGECRASSAHSSSRRTSDRSRSRRAFVKGSLGSPARDQAALLARAPRAEASARRPHSSSRRNDSRSAGAGSSSSGTTRAHRRRGRHGQPEGLARQRSSPSRAGALRTAEPRDSSSSACRAAEVAHGESGRRSLALPVTPARRRGGVPRSGSNREGLRETVRVAESSHPSCSGSTSSRRASWAAETSDRRSALPHVDAGGDRRVRRRDGER